MPTTATRKSHRITPILYLAFELSLDSWKLAFATSLGGRIRMRTIPARDLEALRAEITGAERTFGMSRLSPVVCCYEAGRDGFWLHRFLEGENFTNYVVDPASIETNRRGKKRKTDRLDVRKLLTMLIRYQSGEPDVWSVCRAPSLKDEDRRQLHRELEDLKAERTRHVNRIKGLLIGQAVHIQAVGSGTEKVIEGARLYDGSALPTGLRRRLMDEYQRWKLVHAQIKVLQGEQRRAVRQGGTGALDQVRQLMALGAIGERTAWVLVMELFGWRKFENRRQLGGIAGFAPVPHQSGQEDHDKGISKAGNTYVRYFMVELAWRWIRMQPKSALTRWYKKRFGRGGPRLRKIGIVALARKLLIALWRFLEHGVVPEGAVTKAAA